MAVERDLAAGEATPYVLSILSEGDSYGFAIVKRVREFSGVEVGWTDAMVYPLFHRLRRHGYLRSEWRTVPGGARRRYYALTDEGRAALTSSDRRWLDALRPLTWRGPGPLLAVAA